MRVGFLIRGSWAEIQKYFLPRGICLVSETKSLLLFTPGLDCKSKCKFLAREHSQMNVVLPTESLSRRQIHSSSFDD